MSKDAGDEGSDDGEDDSDEDDADGQGCPDDSDDDTPNEKEAGKSTSRKACKSPEENTAASSSSSQPAFVGKRPAAVSKPAAKRVVGLLVITSPPVLDSEPFLEVQGQNVFGSPELFGKIGSTGNLTRDT
eukprot:7771712-Pyramimonas_sp.AAC.1